MAASNIPDELKELRDLAETTKRRVRNLEALLDAPALALVIETKKLLEDAHKNLERLLDKVTEGEHLAQLGQSTVQLWQIYERLVRLEEKLQRVQDDAPEDEASTYAMTGPVAPLSGKHGRDRSGHSSGGRTLASRSSSIAKSENRLVRHQWEQDRRELGLPMMSASAAWIMRENEPQLVGFYHPSPVERITERIEERIETRSSTTSASQLSGIITALPMVPSEGRGKKQTRQRGGIRFSGSFDALHEVYVQHGLDALPSMLALTREEVEQSCLGEEGINRATLYDPDRKRRGSIPGVFATYVILAGIKDPSHYLPRLRFIKIHEVKRLKELLIKDFRLGRTGDISRIEQVLHLIFILQEGVRMETMAVLFSRTPREVHSGCHEVFDRLLCLHSETVLEYYQPTCHHLWKISEKFMDADVSVTERMESYYGWRRQEVFQVLVTLNLFIGRYRQQGKVALDGPYQHWWRPFAPPEPAG